MTHIVVAHPSADRYGSDLQLVETVRAFVQAEHTVEVLLPHSGPLVAMLTDHGAEVRFLDFPVLRKDMLSPLGLLRLGWSALVTAPRLWRTVRSSNSDTVIWINTITMPSWFLLGRLARRRVITHVHEAETDGPRWARWGLSAPTVLAHRIVTNSAAAADALTSAMPRVAERITVIHNGMPGPPEEPTPPRPRAPGAPATLALVARLSPRKGIDVALEALSLLRSGGRDVHLVVCGTVFEGYEWYENELHDRALRDELAGAVTFLGYVDPTWPIVDSADVVLVPSRVEPFGNTAVEAMLAARPLVASRTQGLCEIVRDGFTGTLVEPDDPTALATAIAKYLDDPEFAARTAASARAEALDRFSVSAYAAAVIAVLD